MLFKVVSWWALVVLLPDNIAALAILSSGIEYSELPACQYLNFTVTASADNKVVPHPTARQLSTQEGVNAFYANLPDVLAANPPNQSINGTYSLVADYCQPVTSGPNGTIDGQAPLQILLHGGTYTKEYWSSGSWGASHIKYSWTYAMNQAGYATLAVDKLGNGASSHPDPVSDVQLPLQMEVVHALITQIKGGHTATVAVPPTIILVGHSSGSILGAKLAQTHPEDVHALVLTGYPADLANYKGGTPSYHFLPAALSAPKRFQGLHYGYLLMNSEFNRTSAFYYAGHYDPNIAHLDYATEGTVALGESFNEEMATRPAFRGKVLVVTGQKDPAICGSTAPEQCAYSDTAVSAVHQQFSENTGFDFYLPPTGHNLNWHYSAPKTYQIVITKLGKMLAP